MSHHHNHEEHNHHHDHLSKAGFVANLGVAALELATSGITNSMAVIQDALHNASDAGFYFIHMVGNNMRERYPSFTYDRQCKTALGIAITGSLLNLFNIYHQASEGVAETKGGLVMMSSLALNGFVAWRALRQEGDQAHIKHSRRHAVSDMGSTIMLCTGAVAAQKLNMPGIDHVSAAAGAGMVLFNDGRSLYRQHNS